MGSTLGDAEKAFIIEGIEKQIRSDGRNRLQYRNICIDTNVITHLNGSSRATLGRTSVVVGVVAKLTEPLVSMPHCGYIEISIQPFGAASSVKNTFLDSRTVHLLPSLRKAYTSPNSFDLPFLCLVPSKKCWALNVDIIVVEDDGSLLDAISMGIYCALYNCAIPKVNVMEGDECNEIVINEDETLQLDPSLLPIVVTFYKIGRDFYILDPTIAEEYCSDCMVQITVNQSDVLAINIEGDGLVSVDEIDSLKKEAYTVAQDLIAKLKCILSNISSDCVNKKQSFLY